MFLPPPRSTLFPYTTLFRSYVDSLTSAHRFTEDDLDFVVAFSGIVAVAIENSRFAERIRHETIVRSNFERFFSPAMAARIAGSDRKSTRLNSSHPSISYAVF